jgi:hypothetical protein
MIGDSNPAFPHSVEVVMESQGCGFGGIYLHPGPKVLKHRPGAGPSSHGVSGQENIFSLTRRCSDLPSDESGGEGRTIAGNFPSVSFFKEKDVVILPMSMASSLGIAKFQPFPVRI